MSYPGWGGGCGFAIWLSSVFSRSANSLIYLWMELAIQVVYTTKFSAPFARSSLHWLATELTSCAGTLAARTRFGSILRGGIAPNLQKFSKDCAFRMNKSISLSSFGIHRRLLILLNAFVGWRIHPGVRHKERGLQDS
jgi:hypothetical protein